VKKVPVYGVDVAVLRRQ